VSDENEIVLRGVLCKLCCCATEFKAETAQTIHNCYSFPSFFIINPKNDVKERNENKLMKRGKKRSGERRMEAPGGVCKKSKQRWSPL
jgi:hypothetical protein